MADGSIVYEVRVDSGKVDSDLSRASTLLDKGAKQISALAESTAKTFGKLLGEVLNTQPAENSVSRMTGALDKLKGAASPLLAALSPVSKELERISRLDLSALNGLIGGKALTSVLTKAGEKTTNNISSFAVGASYIPYDDFPALLHKGEAVLTASENAAYRAAGGLAGANTQQPVAVINSGETGSDNYNRPIEVTLKIGDYEFTQIIADTMNNLHRQWGTKPIK